MYFTTLVYSLEKYSLLESIGKYWQERNSRKTNYMFDQKKGDKLYNWYCTKILIFDL